MIIDNVFSKTILENLYDGVYFVDCDRKILYWNKGAENIAGYTSSEVIGKQCSDILNYIDASGNNLCTTACSLSATMADLIPRQVEVYLHHKDGHCLPVLVRETPILDSQGQVLGAVEIFSDNSIKLAISQMAKELEKLALIDPLTKLANKRYAMIKLKEKLNEKHRYGWPFGILYMEIDHFKKINDSHGQGVGDMAINVVAKTLSNNIRVSDLVAHVGGGYFISIIVTALDEKQLYDTANRLRILIENASFHVDSNIIKTTISIGATLAQPNDTEDTIMARADKLLYYSVSTGQNRVSIKQG